MNENALMRYSEVVGNATDLAAQDGLSPTLMVACLTRFIDVVVRCADDDGFIPNWRGSPSHNCFSTRSRKADKQASAA